MPNTFKAGVRAAAEYLLGTASDYDEMATRASACRNRSPREQAQVHEYTEKAQLLRAQAAHLMALQLPSTRTKINQGTV